MLVEFQLFEDINVYVKDKVINLNIFKSLIVYCTLLQFLSSFVGMHQTARKWNQNISHLMNEINLVDT
jgi:hypothetical protein